MPRRPRLVLPGVPLHLIQRGNNRQACFAAEEDYRFYLDWLKEYAEKTGCRIHAYVLMTNHVHLLVSAERAGAPGAMMKALGQRYVQYFNCAGEKIPSATFCVFSVKSVTARSGLLVASVASEVFSGPKTLRKMGSGRNFRRAESSAVGTDGRESPKLSVKIYAAQR